MERPDLIGGSGALLGQILAVTGYAEKAVAVLATAAAAFEKIGHADGAAHCRELIEKIKGSAS